MIEVDCPLGLVEFIEIEKINNPEDVLRLTAQLLEGEKWWLAFGTALGFYRDKDFIPEDTDIDIGIIGNPSEVQKLFTPDFRLLRAVKYDGVQTQVAFLHDSGLVVDLSFYYPEGDYYVSNHGANIWKDEKRLIDNAEPLETKYGLFPFPSPVPEYLTARYGDWRIKQDIKSISA